MRPKLPNIEIEAFVKGDKNIFREVYDFYYPIMVRYVQSKCAVTEDVEELVQEIFVQLFLGREKIRSTRDIYPLLFTIAKRLTISYFRKQISVQNIHQQAEKYWSYTDNSTEEWIDFAELNSILQKIIENLPPQQRQVYVMSSNENMSMEDIAHTLRLSKNTVKNHLRLATHHVRGSISKIYHTFF